MQPKVGIEEIAAYIPEGRLINAARKELFSIDDNFIEKKIGVRAVAIKDAGDDISDLCVRAYNKLEGKSIIHRDSIDVLVVVTQTADIRIPHTSALVHGRLSLKESCACFDVSMGCSGFVYGLNIIQAFMKENGLRTGLLFTADAYSKIIDSRDKNTALLFGDACTVTLLSDKPLYVSQYMTFGTVGKDHGDLICINDRLQMNGRSVLNFILKYIPDDIHALLKKSKLDLQDIDRFIFHQGSKYIIDMLTKQLKLDAHKVVFDIHEYGNTVSSSIPIILEREIMDPENSKILISGFGTGLSWSSGILERAG